jgi:hypothetical protein
VLDPWQQLVLREALGERRDGSWAASEVGVCVPRQNGKGEIILARELAGLFLFNEQLMIHSAHEYKTAAEGFLRLQALLENNDWLRKQVKSIRTAHGEEGIALKNGNRLRFMARTKGSGRGFSCDCLILDEAMYLGAQMMAATLPTLAARPNPQVWYLGSAGTEESSQFMQVRQRAVDDKPGRLCYLEWSASVGCDPMDDDNIRAANPALGIRIPLEFVHSERSAMPEIEFARERLGIWSYASAEAVIDPQLWQVQADPRSAALDPVSFALTASQNRQWWTVSVAGRRRDGGRHVEVISVIRGTPGVVPRLVDLTTTWFNNGVVIDPSGVAASMIPALESAGVEIVKPSKREVAQACGMLFDGLEAGTVWHLNQPVLSQAALAGSKRQMGDVWVWDERNKESDVSPLTGVSLALYGLVNEPEYNVLDSVY